MPAVFPPSLQPGNFGNLTVYAAPSQEQRPPASPGSWSAKPEFFHSFCALRTACSEAANQRNMTTTFEDDSPGVGTRNPRWAPAKSPREPAIVQSLCSRISRPWLPGARALVLTRSVPMRYFVLPATGQSDDQSQRHELWWSRSNASFGLCSEAIPEQVIKTRLP